jgi:hypothetical protein
MSIPYWREFQYTDDGCSVYQCLNCYSKWESWGAPWWSEDGHKPVGKKGIWVYCPVCGVEWVDQIMPKEKKYHRYYPRYGYGKGHLLYGRLYPCQFKIIETHIDDGGKYISKAIEYGPCEDPEYIVKKLKEYRKRHEEEDFHWFESTTYHVEKESA